MDLRKDEFQITIYHCSTKIISRNKGRSAVASAAYRSGEKLKNKYDDKLHNYSRKTGVVYTEVLLHKYAPSEYKEREILWNAVELAEKNKNAQLAREVEIALPVELNRDEQIKIVREFVNENFIINGMCADIAIHEKHSKKHENPHAHIMLTMRPIHEGGKFAPKSKKEYILDEKGNKQYDPVKRAYKCRKIRATNWDSTEFLQGYRKAWAEKINSFLAQKGISQAVSHLSYAERNIDQIPTIHLGHASHALEKRGIKTVRGNRNREIQKLNQEKINANPLQRILTYGTQQDALNYLSDIRNQYIFLSDQRDDFDKKIEEAIDYALPSAKNRLVSMERDVVNIKGLVNKKIQIQSNIDGLKWWQLYQKNKLLNQSLNLKSQIEIMTDDFNKKWGIATDNAKAEMQDIKGTIKALEQQIEEAAQIKTEISTRLDETKMLYQRCLLPIAAHYKLNRISNILPPIPNGNKRSMSQKLKDYSRLQELNSFTYNEVKDSYTPEAQERIQEFLEKRAEQRINNKRQQDQEYEGEER